MNRAYCAFYMDINPCNNKYKNNPPPQNPLNKKINDFLTCA